MYHDNTVMDSILKEITNVLPCKKNNSNKILHTLESSTNYSYYNKELFSWFNQCLLDVKKDQFIDHIDLVITECWATKSSKFEKHHRHTHPNSIVSGILYLDDSLAATEFYVPNPWAFMNDVIAATRIRKLNVSIKPEKGKLIIFPSNIEHDTKPNLSTMDRHTISFNTFIDGAIGGIGQHLKLNAVSVDSCFNN